MVYFNHWPEWQVSVAAFSSFGQRQMMLMPSKDTTNKVYSHKLKGQEQNSFKKKKKKMTKSILRI